MGKLPAANTLAYDKKIKIIKDVSVGDIVAVIATDELIKDDWIDKANDYIAELNRGL